MPGLPLALGPYNTAEVALLAFAVPFVIVAALVLLRVLPGARRESRLERLQEAALLLVTVGVALGALLDSEAVRGVLLAAAVCAFATAFGLRRLRGERAADREARHR